MGNIARYLHNPINTHPVFLSVGYELSTTATQSVTNRLSDDWGVSTKHQTGVTAHAAAGDLYEIALQREFHEASTDDDVHGHCFTADNVGKGGNVRYETTTVHSKRLQYSSLPCTVQDAATAAGAKEWNPMVSSGIHSTDDLVATTKSDELQRLYVLMQMKAIDEELPDVPPAHISLAPTRVAHETHATRTTQILQLDYTAHYTGDEDCPVIIQRTTADSRHKRRDENIWTQKSPVRLHRQVPEAFAQDTTLLNLAVHNAQLGPGKSHA